MYAHVCETAAAGQVTMLQRFLRGVIDSPFVGLRTRSLISRGKRQAREAQVSDPKMTGRPCYRSAFARALEGLARAVLLRV